MKRKLKDKELALAIKGMDTKKGEVEWFEYQIKYHDLMLETGLEMNHKKNIRDFKDKRREHKENLEVVNSIIKILQEQIRNGVEINEDKKEGKEDKQKEDK